MSELNKLNRSNIFSEIYNVHYLEYNVNVYQVFKTLGSHTTVNIARNSVCG